MNKPYSCISSLSENKAHLHKFCTDNSKGKGHESILKKDDNQDE